MYSHEIPRAYENILPAKKLLICCWVLLLPFSQSLKTYANGIRTTVTIVCKDMPLRLVFSKIEQQTGLEIIYVAGILDTDRKVSLDLRNVPVEKVIESCLIGTRLTFLIKNGSIIIKKQQPSAIEELHRQQISLSPPQHVAGTVTGPKGEPLVGATISIKGTGRATATNSKGGFELKNIPPNAILVISMQGYETVEVKAEQTVAIVLQEKVAVMEDVIVTGFQTIEKKKFAGAATTVKADSIKLNGVTDVSRMLEGRVAGVSVANVSGTFGAAPKIQIRGATSITGDNKPLWVIDGVVLEDIVNVSNDQLSSGDPNTLLGSSVAGLNINDIESFDILKDAAATSLYGARAMNGVIVITTKKGRSGKTRINANINFSTLLKPSYNSYNIMNSAEQMSVYGEMERKGWFTLNHLNDATWGVYGKLYAGLVADTGGHFAIQNYIAHKAAFLQQAAQVNTDWFDVLFKNSLTQEYSLSLSGGNEKFQSFFSTSFFTDNGWTESDRVKRYTLNYRNNYNVSNQLTIAFATMGSVRQQRAPGTVARTENVSAGSYGRSFDINPFSYALSTSRAIAPFQQDGSPNYYQKNFAPFNILTEAENNYLDLGVYDLKLQGELSLKLFPGMRYDFLGQIRYVKTSQEQVVTENSNMANAYRAAGNTTVRLSNPFLYADPDDPNSLPVVVLPYGGFYNRNENQMLSYDLRNNLSFAKTFSNIHSVGLLAGQQVRAADRKNFNTTGYGLQYANGSIPFIDYRILKQSIETGNQYFNIGNTYDRYAAFYFNGQYTYDNTYTLYGTFRYDGGNRLGSTDAARWLPTWSFGGSWNIDRENWLKEQKKVDMLKLRASYGLTASLGNATNATAVFYNSVTPRPFVTERENGISIAYLQNADLTWEKNYTANLGLDFSLFNRRLTGSVDVYKRKSFDLIGLMQTSGMSGQLIWASNYADLKAHGIEFNLGAGILQGAQWSWRTNLTFGYNKNTITNLLIQPNIWGVVKPEGGSTQGYPVNSLFSIRYAGLDPQTGSPILIDESGNRSTAVNLFSQQLGNLDYEGPVDPTITGGFSNTFNYHRFSLNVFITYRAGNKIRLNSSFNSIYDDYTATPKELKNRWTMPGDEKNTNVPAIMNKWELNSLIGNPYQHYNNSDQRVADGAFARLKSITLNYQLPSPLLSSLGMNTATASLSALNLFLLYSDYRNLQGQDPEFFNAGGVALPLQKQFNLTLKLGF